MDWYALKEKLPRRNSKVLVQYVDGYGNFCDYDAVSYAPLSNGTCCLHHLGTTLFYDKVKRWMQIADIPSGLWKTTDEQPAEGEFVLAQIYRNKIGDINDTAYIVLLRRQLSCPKFTGVGYMRYALYHEDERIVRWVSLNKII